MSLSAFDGNSLRVVKVVGSNRTWYLYDGTQLISEFTDNASTTYTSGTTPGQAPAESLSTILYQHGDQLTTRMTTDNSGNLSNEQGHYPYGEQWYATGTADASVYDFIGWAPEKFERDARDTCGRGSPRIAHAVLRGWFRSG